MSVRVHELAKELKISTGALQKHLKDLGISVKSHMSYLDESNADKVRSLFQQERDLSKKREEQRKKYLAARLKEKQEERSRQQAKKHKQEEKKGETRKTPTPKSKAKPIPEKPTFIEKPIEKPTEPKEIGPDKKEKKKADKKVEEIKKQPPKPQVEEAAQQAPQETKPEPKIEAQEKPQTKPSPEKPAKKAASKYKPQKTAAKKDADLPKPPVTPEAEKPVPRKKAKEADKSSDDTELKKKHIQAKIKHSKKGRKKKRPMQPVEEAEIKRTIKQTMSKQKRKKYKKEDKQKTDTDAPPPKIVISEFTSVSELAKIMDVPATEIILRFFKMGKNTTINQRLDKESLEMICDEFDFDVTFEEEYGSDIIEVETEKHKDAEESSRPPVITVMGHVDHGKTSILDYIRSTKVAEGESGRITQHIGASQVEYNGSKLTFLDTPGHEAFTAMRARGAHITDIAILVVAADDSVKPQTVEAIDHAKASGVEIVVAINKIDLKTANPDRVIADLAKHNLFLENYGGDILWATCSATTGQGIDDLLEAVLLVAEMKDLKAKRDVPGAGVVVEARKDSQKGVMATLLVKEGSIEKRDIVICGATYGKIRRMENNMGHPVKKLLPSDVAVVYGLNEVPKGGDVFNKVENEKTAKRISTERKNTRQERERYISRTNMDNIFTRIKEKQMNDIKLIVKADTDGSVEAFCDAVQKLSNEEISVTVIHKAVGAIVEADVNLAIASDAMIAGFHVRADNKAKRLAEENYIDIKTYQIIYEGVEDIKRILEGLIEPEYREVFSGSAVVKQLFRVKGFGVIAGCAVDKGKIIKDSVVRVYRNNAAVYEGKISSLKHFAEDVEEVRAGTECGIGIHNYNDVKEGDVIESYIKEEVRRTL